MSTPASCLNISPERWSVVPAPAEPKVYLPGLAFTSAISSGTERAGMSRLTASRFGNYQRPDTKVKSFTGSKGRLG